MDRQLQPGLSSLFERPRHVLLRQGDVASVPFLPDVGLLHGGALRRVPTIGKQLYALDSHHVLRCTQHKMRAPVEGLLQGHGSGSPEIHAHPGVKLMLSGQGVHRADTGESLRYLADRGHAVLSEERANPGSKSLTEVVRIGLRDWQQVVHLLDHAGWAAAFVVDDDGPPGHAAVGREVVLVDACDFQRLGVEDGDVSASSQGDRNLGTHRVQLVASWESSFGQFAVEE